MKAGTFLGLAGGAGLAALLEAVSTPPWAVLATLAVCAMVLYVARGIRRDLARVRCELAGHGPATFRRNDEVGRCPRCRDVIATRPIEKREGPGLQFCEDTLHQRLARLEAALGIAVI